MTSRLRVWHPEQSTDRYGATVVRWAPYRDGATIAAERRKLTGSRVTESRERFADYKADFWVYLQQPIKRGWKVEDLETGIQYLVEIDIPDRYNNLKLLQCSRIND